MPNPKGAFLNELFLEFDELTINLLPTFLIAHFLT